MSPVRWGVLSTADIGAVTVAALSGSTDARFVAVASRDAGRARAFADSLGITESYGSYEELLASDTVDAVYIPLPISLHSTWTVKSLKAGKHVLCEKPLAADVVDAQACFDAAEDADRMCVEGLMYRHHPQTALTERLLKDGAIGDLTFVRATLSVDVPVGDIRRTTALGGGAVNDLGCYCISAIRLFAGEAATVYAARAADSAPGAEGADLRLAATMTMKSGVLAQFDVGLDYPRRDELELIGTAGKITVPDPWLCRRGHVVLERDGRTETIPVDPEGEQLSNTDAENTDAYRIEFDMFSRDIAFGHAPRFGRADALAQAATLAALRESAEHGYPVDLTH